MPKTIIEWLVYGCVVVGVMGIASLLSLVFVGAMGWLGYKIISSPAFQELLGY